MTFRHSTILTRPQSLPAAHRRVRPSGLALAEAEGWAAAFAQRDAPATAGRTIKRARQFFKTALKSKLIPENVFLDVKASGQANKDRQFHVPREIIFRAIKISQRAGEKPWPKLFHNLCASRETELAADFPIHVVCQWIGNSVAIAAH